MYGDVIYVMRLIPVPPYKYRHYGIEAANDTVIHFQDPVVVHTSMQEFLGPIGVKMVDPMLPERLPREQVVRRARYFVGRPFRNGYSLLQNNCEHFAFHCATGLATSRQVFVTNDDQDIVQKAIDRTFEPLIQAGSKADAIIERIRVSIIFRRWPWQW